MLEIAEKLTKRTAMETVLQSLNVLLPLLYAGAVGLYAAFFYGQDKKLARLASNILIISIIAHTTFLVTLGIFTKTYPISNPFASMSMFALDLAIIYYFVEKTVKEGRTGFFFIGITFFVQLVSSMLIPMTGSTNELLSNPMFGIHTTFTILGISALAVSAIFALMYILLSKEIRSHRIGFLYNGLPSLETLEDMGRYAAGAGIITLGIGILLGHFWAYQVLGDFFLVDIKVIVTDALWLMYLAGWIIVRSRNLYGLKMSRVAFWGFTLFLVTMILINVLGDSFHKFI